jgi:hypothetical protein
MRKVDELKKSDLIIYPTLCLVALCIGFFFPTLIGFSQAQDARFNTVTHSDPPDMPVEILGVNVKGKDIKLGEKIDNDEGWLSNTSFKIKNVSGKTILYVGMYLDFPETKVTGNIMTFPLRYGHNPLEQADAGQPQRLLPDRTADVSLSAKEYEQLKSFILRRHQIADLHKVSLRVTTLYFEDGAIWSNGSWMRPDPGNPHRLIPVQN